MRRFPFLSPYLQAIRTPNNDYLLGGFLPLAPSKDPVPPALMHEIMSRPNLICYDWEITERRLAQWRALSQLGLIASRIPLPNADSPEQNIAEVWRSQSWRIVEP